jgi:uncharacterized protein
VERRDFLKNLSVAAVAAAAAGKSGSSFGQTAGAPVPTRMLGRTGERVSMIGLGGSHIGRQKNPAESIRIIRTAIDGGITFMDNSWDYEKGQSEVRMGQALQDGYRDRVFLMTKIDGRTKPSAARQIEESLKRLQTDHVDLMMFHEVIRPEDADRIFAGGGAMEAMLAAKQAGKVRFIGFTGHKSPVIHNHMLDVAKAHEFVFDALLMPLNVFDAQFDSFQKNVLPRALEAGIGILSMKPIGGGELLKSKTVTATECLQYALSLPTNVVITGCDSLTVLDQALNVARAFRPLDEQQRAALVQKAAPATVLGKYELYKTSQHFDSTAHNPQWLG